MTTAPGAPFFIIGTERSGSNLLRLILNSHPGLYIPHPPHIMKDLGPLEHFYGDLNNDRNFRRLLDAAARLIELHFFPWEVAPDRELAFRQCAARNLYCVKAAFYEQYRSFKKVNRWGCKSTFMVHYHQLARKHSPGAKFIHLVRDGRDVAVSARDSVFNHFHPYYVARLWSAQQRLAAELARTMKPEELLTLRYEELISEPERAAQEVCRFLGETYYPDMLRYFEKPEPRKLAGTSAAWKNCASPVLTGNSGKYRKHLSAAQIKIFEIVAFRELELFGYTLENTRAELLAAAGTPLSRPVRALYFTLEKCKMIYIQAKSLFIDSNALKMLRKKLFLAAEKARLQCRL